jgi:hypothetical protein
MTKLIVLDFDGTVTDAEAEGRPFREGYLEDVATLIDQPLPTVRARAEEIEAEVAQNPDAHGWIYYGHVVAPATVDPYLRMIPVARALFDDHGAFTDELERTRLLDQILYKYNYQKTLTVFRAGAAELLRGLADQPAYVVTNSYTDAVAGKIRELSGPTGDLDWLLDRIHGRAKKYLVDPTFTEVDEALHVEGLHRPVLLRRRLYHQVLRALLDAQGAEWSDLLVVGDIFELDLVLPLHLGARVILAANEFTPPYEQAYVEAHPRGATARTLTEVLELLERDR